MKDIPEVTITSSDLQGWDEFEQWARVNLLLWHHMERQTRDLSEADRARFMIWMLAQRLEATKDEFKMYRWRHPPFGVNSTAEEWKESLKR